MQRYDEHEFWIVGKYNHQVVVLDEITDEYAFWISGKIQHAVAIHLADVWLLYIQKYFIRQDAYCIFVLLYISGISSKIQNMQMELVKKIIDS